MPLMGRPHNSTLSTGGTMATRFTGGMGPRYSVPTTRIYRCTSRFLVTVLVMLLITEAGVCVGAEVSGVYLAIPGLAMAGLDVTGVAIPGEAVAGVAIAGLDLTISVAGVGVEGVGVAIAV